MVQYSPLDTQKSEIRLVTLLPGQSRDAIRCTLSIASLDSAPEYTALSYVWGDLSKTIPITVDNEPFDVTVNLEAGLRAVRKRWKRRVLWIDAICINQEDVQEKNVQVPQMRRLYSTAPAVLMWLGPSNTCIKMFVSWMRAHATRSYNAASAYWLVLDARAAISESGERDRDWAMVLAHAGYYDFMALSYWSRVWTFQEYILPRIEPVCLCGDIKPFQLTTVFENHDTDTLEKVASQAIERLEAGYKMTNEEGRAIMAEVHRRIATKVKSGASSGLWILPRLRNFHGKCLAMLLYFTANRQCFVEHDRIFALYGMVPAVQDVYPPDYAKPVPDVMLQAATYIVNFEHQSSYLWSVFGLRDERLSGASRLCPSWVPDFTQTYNNFLFTYPTINLNQHVMKERVAMPLRLSEDRPACVSVENTTLRFWARRLGACKVAVRFADTQSKILEQVKELLDIDGSGDCKGQTVRKPETLVSRMARACVAHHSSFFDISTKSILETFYTVFNSGPGALHNSSHEFYGRIILSAIEYLAGKDLLITEDGCFGISTGGAKDGDIIVIPPEIEVPLVLTPESPTLEDEIGYFNMVGTAIIDGVMGVGELFDEELVEEVAKQDVVEFLVH
ncbi:hypothetical protein J7T55_015227 [Diaporthe amygdali]|uniref:uncharacterized protein n=1 Tax=Phomopsis amygdali TaxID=1214568 RepID=UPI0022FE4B89|nr:uncharacterized protein J7T55_015227 [Diaporthe amygdali]KAJ0120498.1 hypothetical protein J7T55_015227 [Diaporthe amygdali]